MKINRKLKVVLIVVASIVFLDVVTLVPRVNVFRRDMATIEGGEYVFLDCQRWQAVGGVESKDGTNRVELAECMSDYNWGIAPSKVRYVTFGSRDDYAFCLTHVGVSVIRRGTVEYSRMNEIDRHKWASRYGP